MKIKLYYFIAIFCHIYFKNLAGFNIFYFMKQMIIFSVSLTMTQCNTNNSYQNDYPRCSWVIDRIRKEKQLGNMNGLTGELIKCQNYNLVLLNMLSENKLILDFL